MSTIAVGAWLYKLLPEPHEDGATVDVIAEQMQTDMRSVQRHLVRLEREGLADCEPGVKGHTKSLWWRA